MRCLTKILAAAYMIEEGVDEKQLPRADIQYHLLVAASEELSKFGTKLFNNANLAVDVWGARYSEARTLSQELTRHTKYYLAEIDRLSHDGKEQVLEHEGFVKEILLVIATKSAVKAFEAEETLSKSDTAGKNNNLFCLSTSNASFLAFLGTL